MINMDRDLTAPVFCKKQDLTPRISASLEGGYDSDFTAISESARLNGTITVYNGTVTIEGLVLE